MTGEGKPPVALEDRGGEGDGRLFSPSAARNRDVIRETFLELMPRAGRVLEVGSGTGEHGVHIAAMSPDLIWQASEFDARSRRSVAAWIAHAGLGERMPAPLALNASDPADLWGVEAGLAGVYSSNMIHIAPWAAGRGLVAGAGALLRSGGRLFLYGPFSREGEHVSASNADFDRSLRSRDPEWGVRDLERDVMPVAVAAGLALVEARAMPANNFSVVFERA